MKTSTFFRCGFYQSSILFRMLSLTKPLFWRAEFTSLCFRRRPAQQRHLRLRGVCCVVGIGSVSAFGFQQREAPGSGADWSRGRRTPTNWDRRAVGAILDRVPTPADAPLGTWKWEPLVRTAPEPLMLPMPCVRSPAALIFSWTVCKCKTTINYWSLTLFRYAALPLSFSCMI